MDIYHRSDRIALRVDGADAQKLLNDVLTGEFVAEAGAAHWWALLSPQGKIQAEGLAGWHEGAFWLDVHHSVLENFQKRMRLYTLRADVRFEALGESHKVGWCADEVPDAVTHGDPRGGGLGWRVIAPLDNAGWAGDATPFVGARIALGVCELGADFAADKQFPHDIAMDILGGIDFEKGCYVGQEVVSRMKHRGTARRRPVLVSGPGLKAGASLMVGTREAGVLGAVAGEQGLAIARLDRIVDADAAHVDEVPVVLALPSWASYRFGDSGTN